MRPLLNGATRCSRQDFLDIGSALQLEVTIRHPRKSWDDDTRSKNDGNPLDFRYEVRALPEDWTIGGQKKGHFSANVSISGEP